MRCGGLFASGHLAEESERVRESEFNRRMADEFGSGYGGLVAEGHHLADLDDRTAVQALAAGVPARTVWEAICDAFDVPPARRLGVDLPIVNHPVE